MQLMRLALVHSKGMEHLESEHTCTAACPHTLCTADFCELLHVQPSPQPEQD